MNHVSEQHQSKPGFWGSRYELGLAVFGVAAGYFLLTEHLAHAVGALPFLLLLACPLMHLFMHHGHGGHDHSAGANGTQVGPNKPEHSTD